jgi:hypothetical protein
MILVDILMTMKLQGLPYLYTLINVIVNLKPRS